MRGERGKGRDSSGLEGVEREAGIPSRPWFGSSADLLRVCRLRTNDRVQNSVFNLEEAIEAEIDSCGSWVGGYFSVKTWDGPLL